MKEASVVWYSCKPDNPPRGWRKWMSMAAIDEHGRIFVPAIVSGMSEMAVTLCLGWDGTPALLLKDHVYVPADWVKREYPDVTDIVDNIVAKVSTAHRDT